MFKSIIAASIIACISSTAFAQTATSPSSAASGGTGSHQSIAPNIGGGNDGAVRADPGITNSTIRPGTVNLNRGSDSINPGGNNRAIIPPPSCADQNPSDNSGSAGADCVQ